MPWKKEIQAPQPSLPYHEFSVGGLLNRVRVGLHPYENKTHCVISSIDYCESDSQEIVTEQGLSAAKLRALVKFREFAAAQLAILDDEIANLTAERLIALEGVGIATDVVAEPAA